MNSNIPNIILLTDSYKVSYFHSYNPEIAREITDESRKIIAGLSERLLASAPKPMILIPDIHFFDNLEDSKSPGFSGLDEFLEFLDGK